MPPAARVGDMQACPLVSTDEAATPHGAGPILPPGYPKVMIGGQPAARQGDLVQCVLPALPDPVNSIAAGSAKVKIGGQPAARIGDATAHGGQITTGYAKVMIGP